MRFRTLAKELIYNALHIVGIAGLGRIRTRDGVIILTYHAFSDSVYSFPGDGIPVTRFKSQMKYLRRHYSVVSLEEAFHWLRDRQTLIRKFEGRPKAVITVDDGFADNFEIMLPVVRALEVPITVFLATDFLDTGKAPWPTMIKAIIQGTRSERMEYPFSASLRTAAGRSAAVAHIKTLWRGLGVKERGDAIAEFVRHLKPHFVRMPRPLTWEQVRRMRQQGITFGSHTVHHSMLPFIVASQAHWELVQSRRRIEEELKDPCHWFTYPNGDYDDSSMSLVAQAGYLAALTQERGINHPGTELMALHRIEVPKDESIGCFACRASLVAI